VRRFEEGGPLPPQGATMARSGASAAGRFHRDRIRCLCCWTVPPRPDPAPEGEGKRRGRSKVWWPAAGSRGGGGAEPPRHGKEAGPGRSRSGRHVVEEGHSAWEEGLQRRDRKDDRRRERKAGPPATRVIGRPPAMRDPGGGGCGVAGVGRSGWEGEMMWGLGFRLIYFDWIAPRRRMPRTAEVEAGAGGGYATGGGEAGGGGRAAERLALPCVDF
jgi:hypothetical protein